uniref:Uncharacterized protein n=1 Tax=Myoviridae sp. ctm8X17 TaxID=2825168 RepID=A0A8S5Q851_9CAUD|nr:MAG TPA: hypothetical protein [Myoviridae sp. ctm8X17]
MNQIQYTYKCISAKKSFPVNLNRLAVKSKLLCTF